jgi:hypothetical protein
MEFWLGRWEVTFAAPDGELVTGSNTVSEHEGRIYELFVVPDEGSHYVGASVTRFDQARGVWAQEYWDNHDYRAWYEGNWQDDRFILDLTGRGGHPAGAKRLVWRDITADSLGWDNEQTDDGGRTWASTWTIQYRRLPRAGD